MSKGKRPTRFDNIDTLVKGGGDVTIGRIGPVRCAATAADGDQPLAMLVRRLRESFEVRELGGQNHVIEHVRSRPDGTNGYRNAVAACIQCNNRKGAAAAEDYGSDSPCSLRLLSVGLATGAVEAVPRHTETSDLLARKICRGLSVPEVGR